MATQFENTAVSKASVDGTELTFTSNTVTAELFDTGTLSLLKEQNKDIVSTGSTISYTITITNNGTTDLTNVVFTDTIPTGLEFVVGSFKVDSAVETPSITGQDIEYTIPTITTIPTVVEFDAIVTE